MWIQREWEWKVSLVKPWYAWAVIRKHARAFLCKRRFYWIYYENIKDHHQEQIWLIQLRYWHWKNRPWRIHIKRFKEVFLACIKGWKIWRFMEFVKNQKDYSEYRQTWKEIEEILAKKEKAPNLRGLKVQCNMKWKTIIQRF